MPLQTTFDFPRADVVSLFAQIDRAQNELGKSFFKSLAWAGSYVAKSLNAASKVAPKNRRVYKTTARRLGFIGRLKKPQRAIVNAANSSGVYGVDVWKDGVKTFTPIQAGETRTADIVLSNGVRLVKNLNSGKIVHHSKAGQFDTQTKTGAKQSNLVKIRYRKLAKSAWAWATANMYRGGSGSPLNVAGAISINLVKSKTDPAIKISNLLKYASSAFKTGDNAPEHALGNAARKLEKVISDKITAKMGAA